MSSHLYQDKQEIENYLQSIPLEVLKELFEHKESFSPLFQTILERVFLERT